MTRKEAREETFFLTFERLFSNDSPEEILNLAEEVRDLLPDEYVKKVFFGICEKQEELDAIMTGVVDLQELFE